MLKRSLVLEIGLAALAWAVQPNSELPPWVLQLARIKQSVRTSLEHLPNYICLETVNRFRALERYSEPVKLDTLRLEIASVDGKELFISPRSGRLETPDLREHARSGLIGTGTFSAFLHNLFVAGHAQFTFAGQEELLTPGASANIKRQVLRFDFELSSLLSSYTLTVNGESGLVGFRGSFWADSASLELLRLQLHALELPPELALVKSVGHMIDYARVRVGKSEVLLPKSAETLIAYSNGARDRNLIEFSGCREFVSESTIHFLSNESIPAGEPQPPKPRGRGR